jgi:hypothetical protein
VSTTGRAGPIERFLFEPATDRPLAVLRIGLSAILLFQAASISSHLLELYGAQGIMQGKLASYLTGGDMLERVGLRQLMTRAGISESVWLRSLFATYVAALVGLVLGAGGRISAAIACVAHSGLGLTGTVSNYGVDQFAQFALFYLVICPGTVTGLASSAPGTAAARVALRLLQLNLCLAYLGSGIAKALGSDWWTGEAIWRSVMMPVYETWPMGWMAFWPGIAKLACWGTLLLELGYPLFVWPRTTRMLWVIGIVMLHLGIAGLLRLVSFGLVMAVLTLAAFGVCAEPDAG